MNSAPILIVDDEPDIRELLALTLSRLKLDSDEAESVSQAIEKLENNTYCLCLTDMRLPDGNGLDIVSHINEKYTRLPVAVITAHGNMDTAIEALKRGAFDFLNKPIELQQLKALVEAAIKLPEEAEEHTIKDERSRLTGQSAVAVDLRKKLVKVARSQAPVFIHGESGSGKEVCARLIHENSARSSKPFIAVNCGAIPSELMESEFFGHKKGAFTGAVSDEPGLFLSANGGTLLLDEVADLPLAMQVKLLRAIQEKNIKPVGSNQEISVDVRIISATHKNLSQLVEQNLFRSDLFYRINVIDIDVPPLRERSSDIKLIAEQILQRIAQTNGVAGYSLSTDALEKLQSHPFPGNIRELENTLERTVALCDTTLINADSLLFQSSYPTEIRPFTSGITPIKATVSSNPAKNATENIVDNTADSTTDNICDETDQQYDPCTMPLDDYLLQIEKREITKALEKCRWNKTETARYLGMSFRSLRYRLQKLGLDE